MGVIDFILSLVALLLWSSWRAMRFDPLVRTSVSSLAGTLRPAEPRKLRGWHLLAALLALLLFRALLCWKIGSPAGWYPRINLSFVVLAFRGDSFPSAALYSVLEFLRLFLVIYFWVVAVSFVNRDTADTDAILKLLRLYAGRFTRWPRVLQAVLPLVAVLLLWVVCQPLLVKAGVISRVASTEVVIKQGLLVGLALYLTLKYLFPALLLLHFVSSYVYFGNNPFWDFIGNTGRGVLSPLKSLPLRIGRLDLAPLLGIILILLLLEALPRWVVQELRAHQRVVWPH